MLGMQTQERKQLSFGDCSHAPPTAAPPTGDHDEEPSASNEIKLWDPSLFSGGLVDDYYQQHGASPTRRTPAFVPNPHKFDGTTTTADSYRAHSVPQMQQSVAAPHFTASPHRFEGRTTTADDFQAPQLLAQPPRALQAL